MTESINSLKQNTAQLSVITTFLLLILKLLVGIYTGTISIISEKNYSGTNRHQSAQRRRTANF